MKGSCFFGGSQVSKDGYLVNDNSVRRCDVRRYIGRGSGEAGMLLALVLLLRGHRTKSSAVKAPHQLNSVDF